MTTELLPAEAKPPQTLEQMFDEWRQCMIIIDQADGEISDAVQERLIMLDLAIPEKVDAWCYVMEREEAEIDFWDHKENFAAVRKKRHKNVLEFMKLRAKHIMLEEESKKIRGVDMQLELRNGGKKLVCPDEGKLPLKYFREVTTYVLDKEALRADLEQGIVVKGAHLEDIISLHRNVNSNRVLKGELIANDPDEKPKGKRKRTTQRQLPPPVANEGQPHGGEI